MKVVLIDADSLFYAICFGKFNEFTKTAKGGYDIRQYYNHLDLWMEDIIKKARATHYLAFWTNGRVFRHTIDPNYKSGRPDDKPIFFDDIRRYFMFDEKDPPRSKWKGIAVKGLEAEDLVAIYSTHYINNNIDYCIARIDHDLDQLAGEHYNFKDDTFSVISYDNSEYNLWKQVLQGCVTDKVVGLKGVGDVKAAKYLSNISTDNLSNKVLETYIKHEGWEIGQERFKEVYSLIYLLRTVEEVKKYLGIDYILQEPYYYSTVRPNMFGNITKPIDNNDNIPDFLL